MEPDKQIIQEDSSVPASVATLQQKHQLEILSEFLATPGGNLFSVLVLLSIMIPFAMYTGNFEIVKVLITIFSTLLVTGQKSK